MSNLITHKITVVGPMEEVQRFVKELEIVSGNRDPITFEPEPNAGPAPAMNLGPGRYAVTHCHEEVCSIDIELEVRWFDRPGVAIYRSLRSEYPTLTIIWRYYLGMNGLGYIDDDGDHLYREEEPDKFMLAPRCVPTAAVPNDAAPAASPEPPITAETQEVGAAKTYAVVLHPQYRILIVPSEGGQTWAEARREFVLTIAFLDVHGALVLPNDIKDSLRTLALCHEEEYPRALAEHQRLVDERNPRRKISPEAMSDDKWIQHLKSLGFAGFDYIRNLLQSNGSTGNPPDGQSVIWGLRHNESGRWMSNSDMNGVESMQIFRTRDLAAKLANPDLCVVWMNVGDWWKKVFDAAETGYPPNVNLVFGIAETGIVKENSFPCTELAPSPAALLGLIDMIRGRKHRSEKTLGELPNNDGKPQEELSDEEFIRGLEKL